jgi:RNA polymerase sigma factor (sigma-70 family)
VSLPVPRPEPVESTAPWQQTPPAGVPPGTSSDPESTFRTLVLRYQDGDPGALASLHEGLLPAIRSAVGRLLRRQLPGSLGSDDLQQQAWIVLAEIASRWQPTGSFLAYFSHSFERELRRFVSRSLPGRGSQGVRVITIPHEELMQLGESLTAGESGPDMVAILRQELAGLSPREREAVVMHVLEEKDFASIGRRLNISRATAHRLYRRALLRLVEQSDGREPDRGISS